MIKVVREITKPNSDAINVLKDALKKAESGEILSVGVAWINKDQGIGGDISGGSNDLLMWSSLEHNARQFYNNVIIGDA